MFSVATSIIWPDIYPLNSQAWDLLLVHDAPAGETVLVPMFFSDPKTVTVFFGTKTSNKTRDISVSGIYEVYGIYMHCIDVYSMIWIMIYMVSDQYSWLLLVKLWEWNVWNIDLEIGPFSHGPARLPGVLSCLWLQTFSMEESNIWIVTVIHLHLHSNMSKVMLNHLHLGVFHSHLRIW